MFLQNHNLIDSSSSPHLNHPDSNRFLANLLLLLVIPFSNYIFFSFSLFLITGTRTKPYMLIFLQCKQLMKFHLANLFFCFRNFVLKIQPCGQLDMEAKSHLISATLPKVRIASMLRILVITKGSLSLTEVLYHFQISASFLEEASLFLGENIGMTLMVVSPSMLLFLYNINCFYHHFLMLCNSRGLCYD